MKNSSILLILLLWYIKGNLTFDDKNKLFFENATRGIQVYKHEHGIYLSFEEFIEKLSLYATARKRTSFGKSWSTCFILGVVCLVSMTQDSIEFVKNRRIFKGTKSKIKHYPFVVSVHLMRKYQCVGSIIKSDLVITACSCVQILWNNRFYRENPSVIAVNVGSSFYTGGGETIAVIEAYFHPSYDPQTLTNNLAILRLTRRLNFRKKYVKKISIAPPGKLSYNTEEIVVIGWGAKTMSNKIDQPWSNRLSYAELHIYPLSECGEVYHGKYERVTSNNFCGGFYSKGGGACNGDVGAPAIIDNQLVGVVSFASPSCGVAGKPTVFTKLAMYRDWIISIIDLRPPVQKKKASTSDPFEPLYSMSDEEKQNSTTDTATSVPSSSKIQPVVEPVTATSEFVDMPTTSASSASDLRAGVETFKSNKDKMKQFILDLFESKEFLDLYKNITDKLVPVTSAKARHNYESKYDSNEGSNEEPSEVGLRITKMAEINDEVEVEDNSVGLDLALPDINLNITPITPKSKPTTKQVAHTMQTSNLLRKKDDGTLNQFNDRDIIMLYLPDRKRS